MADTSTLPSLNDMLSSAVGVLNTPINAPKAAGVNTAPFQKELERTKQSRNELDQTIATGKQTLATATEQTKAGIDQKASGDTAEVNANQDRAQLIADQNQWVNELYGINTKEDGEVAKTAIQARNLKDDALQKLDDIKQKQSVGLLDSPIDFLVNTIQLPSDIETYNTTAAQANLLQHYSEDIMKNSSAAQAQLEKGVPTITTAQAAAKATIIAGLATQAKAAADENLAKANLTFAQNKMAADISVLEGQGKLSQLQLENSKAAYSAAINNIQLADTHATRLLKAAELIEKIGDQKSLEAIIKGYDAATGKAPGTTSVFAWKGLPSAMKEEIVAIGSTGTFGSNPVQALISFARSAPGANVSEQTRTLMGFTAQEMQKAEERGEIKNEVDGAKKAQKLSTAVTSSITGAMNTASQGPQNPFYELSPTAMIKAGFVPPNTPFGKVLQQWADTKTQPTTAQVLAGVQASAGTDNPVELGQIAAQYYQVNMIARNSLFNLKTIGIQEQMPSNYTIKAGGVLGMGSYKLDLTKPEDATKYFLLQKNRDALGATLPGATSGTSGALAIQGGA